MLGRHDKGEEGKSEQASTTEVEGPPDRPTHDPQIEEFIRDAHKSTPVTMEE
jgi:hypothetical protein